MKKRIRYEPIPPEFVEKKMNFAWEMLDKLCIYHLFEPK